MIGRLPARISLPAEARRARSRGGARRRAGAAALLLAAASVVVALAPAAVLAHPLGNFTINHFAAIRVAAAQVSLDIVIDRAEIPAYQEQQRLDLDGDGVLAPAELEPERQRACGALAADLGLTVDGTARTPGLTAAGLGLSPGAGGLSTMRLVCEYELALTTPLRGTTSIEFEDRSFAERIGWREIVVLGDGISIASADPGTPPETGDGISGRLTTYPTDLLAQPLDERSIRIEATPGGPGLAPWAAPDAQPIGDTPAAGVAAAGTTAAFPGVPGGITEDLAALINLPDLNPIAVLVALAIAFGLGVIHAISPGHGKTIMAAYLVGGRGSSRQAIGLGVAVAVSHTLGVLALAVITTAASSVLPPERLYPILGLASGGLVIVIGASLLWARLRAMRADGRDAHTDAHGHDHGQANGHGDADDHGHAHSHVHPHPHPHPHDHAPAGDSISWRGLIALGLSGGLVPSASALILLLGSIAAGVPAYGLVLVLSFGLGMAVVLGGIGFALVHARRLMERRPLAARLNRVAVPIQLATASIVVVLGVVLTGQALAQVL